MVQNRQITINAFKSVIRLGSLFYLGLISLFLIVPECLWAAAPSAVDATTSDAAEGPSAEPPTFQLNELRVLGNTMLPGITVSKLLYPFLGPMRSLQDVESARQALENEYRAQGYGSVYVDIPEQTVAADGVVRLHVTEATLRVAAITGARYFSNRQIRAAIPLAEKDTVPNLPKLQAQVNAVNAVTPDRQVTPVLKAGPVPGTVDLSLNVQDQLPLHAVAEVNNQYTADTSKLRVSLKLSYDDAFARQDSLSLQYQTSPQDTREVGVFAASYLARLSDRQNKLSISYIDSSSRVATIGDILVAGKGKTYNVDFIHPLQASSDVVSSATIGVHFKDSAQGVSLPDDKNKGQADIPVRYTVFQAVYSLSLFSEVRVWSFASSLTMAIPGLGSSPQQFADKCYLCKPSFSVLHLDGGVTQKLPLGLSLALQTTGQYSLDPLTSNEQFLIGGAHSVRGYLEADELGDIGMRGSLELRASRLIPSFAGLSIQPYLFYDAALASFNFPLADVPRSASLQSTGVGVDFDGWRHLTGTLLVGRPLVTSSHSERGDTRVQFWLRGSW